MRNAWLAALIVFCLLTGGWVLVQGRAGQGDGDFADALAEQAEAALADANASENESAGEPGGFYRYTDESGSMHFVSSLAEVPKHLRDKARAVTNDRVQRAPSSPAPAQRMRTARAEPARAERAIDKEVVVYTTSWCGWCRKTLAFLTEQGVAFENRDIEANEMWRDELEEKTGSSSIPVVEIDGEIIRGYNPTRMQELLEAS
jgi:glutaredoxin-like YruB-family protein